MLQAIYSLISPGWFVTPVFGNDHYLFRSAYFWLSIPLVICVALAPRYLYKAWKFGFDPDDLDKLRYIRKMEPNKEIHAIPSDSGLRAMRQRPPSSASHADSVGDASSHHVRPSLDHRLGSRTDMATGIRSVHRGFDFSMEENGVAMRRIQSRLSERHQSNHNLAVPLEVRHRGGSLSRIRRALNLKTKDD
jgi:phospholipid-translocating ATPase